MQYYATTNFTWMSSTDDSSEISNFISLKIWKAKSPLYISIQLIKCIAMNTNKPKIGSVVLKKVTKIWRNSCEISTFLYYDCSQYAQHHMYIDLSKSDILLKIQSIQVSVKLVKPFWRTEQFCLVAYIPYCVKLNYDFHN